VIMFDEPEIGCSEETQAGMGIRIAKELDTLVHLREMYIVTHSRQLVKQLLPLNPTHWRLAEDGMTLQQFVEREVVPTDLDALKEEGLVKWRIVEKIMEEKRKKK